MTTGPCLCGDPYCPKCGNPGVAAYSDAIDVFEENISELDMDIDEIEIFYQAGKKAVEHYRKSGGNCDL